MKLDTDKKAKEKIIVAALELFYYQGFSSTTVRQIAREASVNQALISYYFGGKKGLIEQLMVKFYEGYFLAIEEGKLATMEYVGQAPRSERLLCVMKFAFDYLFDSYKMTRFIYRELTMDSMLIREVMTTYLAKEKYFYTSVLEEGLEVEEGNEKGEHTQLDVEIMVLQILNALYMPFLQPQVIREVHYIEPHSDEFKSRYFKQLEQWITKSFQ
jgi:AcrR family transcriptional regulator